MTPDGGGEHGNTEAKGMADSSTLGKFLKTVSHIEIEEGTRQSYAAYGRAGVVRTLKVRAVPYAGRGKERVFHNDEARHFLEVWHHYEKGRALARSAA